MTDFDALLKTLEDQGVQFIVVGGAAAIAHGSSRSTQDLDMVDALAPLKPYLRGAPPGLPFIRDRLTLERGLNFTLLTSIGELDLLGEIPGGASTRSLSGRRLGFGCRARKRAAGRPRDLDAPAELQAIQEET